MTKLGTWSTFDCPIENINIAFKYLFDRFDQINGRVRKINNPHDFGPYPSFEIDLPIELENLDEDDTTSENLELLNKKDEWEDKANQIEDDYNKKFEKYL